MQESQPANNFKGRIGVTREQSTPAWEERAPAPKGAPNVVIVYMDDMGFSDLGCFGGEIETPHIDALAARGLRFNHYTTHPMCSAARAALLTGMNPHAVGTGWLTNNDPGYPGYSGELPLDAATMAETFGAAGYETIMVGKWHNTPTRDCVPSAPKSSWPSSRGFDTFYGFMEGETHYFFPAQLMRASSSFPSTSTRATTTRRTTGPTSRSSASRSCARPRRRSPSCCTSRTMPCTRRCRRSRTTSPSTADATPAAGPQRARHGGRSRSTWASFRRTRGCRSPIRACRTGRRRTPRTARCWRSTWSRMRRCSTASTRTWAGSSRFSSSWASSTTRSSSSRRTTAAPTPVARRACSTTIAASWACRRRPSKWNARPRTISAARAARPCIRRAGARCRTRPSLRSRRTPAPAGGGCRS